MKSPNPYKYSNMNKPKDNKLLNASNKLKSLTIFQKLIINKTQKLNNLTLDLTFNISPNHR
jgi:hypothetical protein